MFHDYSSIMLAKEWIVMNKKSQSDKEVELETRIWWKRKIKNILSWRCRDLMILL